MVTTVTLNPCIDLTLYLDSLLPGGLNLVRRSRSDTCGKGVNVSVALRALGISTICTGVSFDGNGALLDQYLEEQCVARDFAVAHGNIRTNIKLMDESKNEMTEVNSAGEPVAAQVIAEYLEKLLHYAEESEIVTFSGRIPNGADAGIYRQSLEKISHLPVKTVVDAEKESLREAIKAKPYLIKPNLYELETILGRKLASPKEVAAACREVIAQGVSVVCCSMGGGGAIIADQNEAWFAPVLDIPVRGFQGAGDSMVAGICKGMHENRPVREMLAFGVAAASASLLREGTQLCRPADYNRLLSLVKTFQIHLSK